jgi:hypothetical protein
MALLLDEMVYGVDLVMVGYTLFEKPLHLVSQIFHTHPYGL